MLFSQYRKFSVTASVGYSLLNLGAVDDENQSDVRGWAGLGIPVGQFASIKQSPFCSAGAGYRFDREFGFSLTWSYWRKTVSSSYKGGDATLVLERGVGSTDFVLGIAYYPDVQLSFLEWYVQGNLDLEFARATASAVGSQYIKIAGVPTPYPLIATEGIYKKTKTSAGFTLGADTRLLRHLFFRTEATYRFAVLGTLDGDITRFGEPSVETSTVGFDFSGVLFSAGIRFEL
jgi:hypothetical protein